MDITLRVSANKLTIFGKGNITLEDTSTHTSASKVGFLGVLGDLEYTTTTIANRPVRGLHLLLGA